MIDFRRTGLVLVGLLAAVSTLLFGRSLTEGNIEALRILVTVFSILAGILIAVITMLGDPRALYPGSWRIASAHRRNLRRVLSRYQCLFYVYLAVIALAFVGTLFGRISCETEFARWFGRVALSLGAGALVWSFGLPAAIIKAQMERLDEEVRKRRKFGKPQDGRTDERTPESK